MAAMAPTHWPMPDGTPIACREKLRVLAENHVELAQVLQDAWDDAVLIGVDPAAFRAVLAAMIDGLRSPLSQARA